MSLVNLVVNALSKQLHRTFGDGYRIYFENVEQGLERPCFTIDIIEPLERSINKTQYNRVFPMVIHYFGKDRENYKKSNYDIAEKVLDSIEYLPIERTLIRAENISWHNVDDVLQIFVTYRFKSENIKPETGMGDLELNTGTKGKE